jgi:bifunctional DNA-binding transcriptional regulator/antitoxin component of YhaV-PrlF toxin-antitoxin module
MLLTTTLTDDFKLPIPQEALDAAGWRPGQLFEIYIEGRNVGINATTAEQFQYALEDEREMDAEMAALGGPEPIRAVTPDGNPIEALRGLMVGKKVDEFVRDRDDRC